MHLLLEAMPGVSNSVLVTTSKVLAPRSDALVTRSLLCLIAFLILLVRDLLLEAMPLVTRSVIVPTNTALAPS